MRKSNRADLDINIKNWIGGLKKYQDQYTAGITLFRLKKFALFISFLEDIVVDGIDILSLAPEDLKTLNQSVQQFSLDFDDAYQYAVAEKHDLQLISFDRDFDRTARKRKEPAEVLE